MSATTEKLLEDIKQAEANLFSCQQSGNSAGALRLTEELVELRLRLKKANQALNENKQVLKG
jgi:hypothetical protein